MRIHDNGIHGTASRLKLPRKAEGFVELWYVRLDDNGGFIIEEWNDEL